VKHIIIVGCQRSGTTLLGQLLGSHPRAVLIDENDGLYDWVGGIFSGNGPQHVQSHFHAACAHASGKYVHAEDRFTAAGGLLPQVEYLVMKAPNLTYCPDEIARHFPGASIVYALRDIRDVVASMATLRHIPIVDNQIRLMSASPLVTGAFEPELSLLNDPRVEAHRKRAIVAKVKMSLARHFTRVGLPVLSVRYEDLVADPTGWCDRLTSHLHMPPSDVCLRHHEVMHGLGPGRTERARAVDQGSVAHWTTELTEQEERDVWEIGSDLMARLGYQRNPPPDNRALKTV